MYIHYSIDKDGNHLMQLPELNLKAYGRDKEEAHRNLLYNIQSAIVELEAMARSDIGNIQLHEIIIRADIDLIDKEQFKTILDIVMKQGRANGFFGQKPTSEQINPHLKEELKKFRGKITE